MSIIQRQTFNILTDTGANYTDTGPPVSGFIWSLDGVLGDTGQLDTGADLRIVNAKTNRLIADYDNIGATSFSKTPRQPTADTGGAELGDAYIPLAGEPLKVTVSGGGVAKRATLHVYVGY